MTQVVYESKECEIFYREICVDKEGFSEKNPGKTLIIHVEGCGIVKTESKETCFRRQGELELVPEKTLYFISPKDVFPSIKVRCITILP